MPQIFESVRPEVTLFLGAHDSNFPWVNQEADSVRFSSGLMNLLNAFSAMNFGKFVYLSSVDVYEGVYWKDISEDTPARCISAKALALAQAEMTCENFRKSCMSFWQIPIWRMRLLLFIDFRGVGSSCIR